MLECSYRDLAATANNRSFYFCGLISVCAHLTDTLSSVNNVLLYIAILAAYV